MERLLEYFMHWAPMILLIAVWLYMYRKTGTGFQQEILNETRRHNERLEQLLVRMDERIATLEAKNK